MKVQVFIHAKYDVYEKKFVFNPMAFDGTDYDCGALVGTAEVEFDPPPYDVLVNGTIKQYREEQKKILADAEVRRAAIERRINELLCIEYKPEVA
jgi:hypothetical protein